MSKYLTGQEVIAALNIEDFELVELARKGMIQPFTPYISRDQKIFL